MLARVCLRLAVLLCLATCAAFAAWGLAPIFVTATEAAKGSRP